jgi:hypothetical protein
VGLLITGHALAAIRDWTFQFGPNVCASTNALLFGALALSGIAAFTPVGSSAEAAKQATSAPRMTASAATVAGLAPCLDLKALPTARCGVLHLPLVRRNPAKGTTPIGFALIPHRHLPIRAGRGRVPNPVAADGQIVPERCCSLSCRQPARRGGPSPE